MIKHQMFIAAALLVGVAIGYFVKDEPIPAEEPKVEEKTKKSVVDKGEEASVKALRRRIAELERALAEQDGKSEIATSAFSSFAANLFSSSAMRWRSALTVASSPLSATGFFAFSSTFAGSFAATGSSLTKYPIATPTSSATAMNIWYLMTFIFRLSAL